jgi:hypothetical protein
MTTVPEMRMPGTGLVMNQSKPSGSAAGSNLSPPAKAAAPAGPSGIPGRPVNAPVRSSGAAAPRPTGTPTRSAGSASPKPASAPPGAAPVRARPGEPQESTGKVVHDERGNAVWDWIKQTGRHAIESTTRMLRKLETPELKVEQPHEEELRIQPDGDACSGGGYDPYNQPIKSRRTPIK